MHGVRAVEVLLLLPDYRQAVIPLQLPMPTDAQILKQLPLLLQEALLPRQGPTVQYVRGKALRSPLQGERIIPGRLADKLPLLSSSLLRQLPIIQ